MSAREECVRTHGEHGVSLCCVCSRCAAANGAPCKGECSGAQSTNGTKREKERVTFSRVPACALHSQQNYTQSLVVAALAAAAGPKLLVMRARRLQSQEREREGERREEERERERGKRKQEALSGAGAGGRDVGISGGHM